MNLAQMINVVKEITYADDDTLITAWLNEGYLALAEAAKIEASTTLNLVAGTDLYSLPADFVSLKGIQIGDKWLEWIDEKDIIDLTGEPSYYYLRQGQIGIYPKPAENSTATLFYYKYPAKMVNGTDTPVSQIPERYHYAIVEYALSKAQAADRKYDRAAYHERQFLAAKGDLMAQIGYAQGFRGKVRVVL